MQNKCWYQQILGSPIIIRYIYWDWIFACTIVLNFKFLAESSPTFSVRVNISLQRVCYLSIAILYWSASYLNIYFNSIFITNFELKYLYFQCLLIHTVIHILQHRVLLHFYNMSFHATWYMCLWCELPRLLQIKNLLCFFTSKQQHLRIQVY